MGEHIHLNDDWKYSAAFHKDMTENSFDESSMDAVRLPHTNIETPFHYFDEQIYQFVSCYRRRLDVKEEWKGKQVLLTFEGVAHVATVYVNGKQVTTHFGGYTAFTVDLEPYLNFASDKSNILTVEVDSRESDKLPPFGNVIDYLTYGGIYREVYLDIKEHVAIKDVFVITRDPDSSASSDKVAMEPDNTKSGGKVIDLQIKLHGLWHEEKALIKVNLTDASDHLIYSNVLKITALISHHKLYVEGVNNWEPEFPVLYHLQLELFADSDLGRKLDEKTVRFGFRTCEFKEDGFYLNHKKIKLIGLNRHQSYPYVGYAMPKRMQLRDAEILKEELQVNAVRTSHYPQSQHFINRCDELGLLVFTEIPGWQHIGDNEWKAIACENVKEMVLQYRNHPSIILWGVRINESQDDDAFYAKTNQIAHELDPSRQTGGVRYLKKSSLLEDVYTYNDFLHNGITKGLDRKKDVTSDRKSPYLVSEFNGHMFPTKAFDNEEHRLQHALRYACVLNETFAQKDIAGAFGWCMFDYNTHKDFGSGDRICYHGVMDMFRNPKLAAAVYASQKEENTVFELSSSLDIGDHPAGNIGDVYAFTNADSIRLYKNDQMIKEFHRERSRFDRLPHPPVVIDDFVGDLLEKEEHFSHKTSEAIKKLLFAVKKYGPNQLPLMYKLKMAYLMVKEHLTMEMAARLYYQYIGSWGGAATTFRFEAVKEGRVVKVINKNPSCRPKLEVITKTTELQEEETYDVGEVRIQVVDENNNRLPYYQEPVRFEVWGAIELIGPREICLKGGMGGTYVKTKGILGEGGLKIYQEGLGETEIKFTVLSSKD
ncbi:MAG TPA: glycoside hydrolase family 2 TIM barrel-domain containing protein [Mobilitalea sp.]|nr:glycoside hydrolase family 2 TIM barrel-domain containing protein [Mobilitalea sp.]